MRALKRFLAGLVIGALLGLWFGVNIGREQPIFANPFAEPTLQEKIKQGGADALEKSGEVLKQGGEKLKEQGERIVDDVSR